MKFLSRTLVICLAAAVTLAGSAAAATLVVGSKTLSAGNATTTACGVLSLTPTRNVDNAGRVTRVGITGVPLTCSGETVSVTLVGASNVSLGTGTGVVGSCTTTCSVSITASVTNFGTAVSAASVLSFSFAAVGA